MIGAEKKIKIDDDFINNNVFIYDTYDHQIILYEDRDKSEPFFERYVFVGSSGGDFYIDTYFVEYPKTVIDFAYDYESKPKEIKMWDLRDDYLKSHGLDRREIDGRLHTRLYPKKKFIEMLEKSFN